MGIVNEREIKVITWDWRERPDPDELDELVSQVSNGACRVRMVPDTQSDQYAMTIAPRGLSDDEAQAAWKQYNDDLYADDDE
jgi:hypothetical protein